jgi:hypothetical protein
MVTTPRQFAGEILIAMASLAVGGELLGVKHYHAYGQERSRKGWYEAEANPD